jgi:F-type H+-transporting ATPase subunit b
MTTFATALVLATQAGEEASGLDLVLPAAAELIWGLVGFALLMAVLWARVFPLLNRTLDERAARIQGQIEEAERQRVEAEQLRRKYEEQLADARNQANEILDQARKDAERIRHDAVGKAEEEAAQVLARAREEAEAVRARLVQDLRIQVAVASVELAGKIVGRELDAERHRALVDEYINELSGLN